MKIAITGGIGSGKSYVCRLLKLRGIQVYDCDERAKHLMSTSLKLQDALSELIGKRIFVNGKLQKGIIAEYLLANVKHQQAINEIVHPMIAQDFYASGLDWLESAIYFDSGFNERVNIDKVVCVSAPYKIRLERVMKRDHISEEQAAAWIEKQMAQEEVIKRSDYNIVNDGSHDLDKQIDVVLSDISDRKLI